MNDDVIPFGKHKGKTVEQVLRDDPQYLQWLPAQSWMPEKFPALYQVIINYGREPVDTPEHNALQVLFLDKAFCLRFAQHVTGAFRTNLENVKIDRYFEWHGLDVFLKIADRRHLGWQWSSRYPKDKEKFLQDLGYDDITVQRASNSQIEFFDLEEKFIKERFNGCLNAELKIEIKPVVSDDYPAVLRQMYGLHAEYLFIEHYTGVGATREQFIKTFDISDITVVFRSDLS